MQKFLYGLIGLFSISGVLFSAGLPIIPSPQDVTFREGNLEISDSSKWYMTLSGGELQGQPAVNYLVQTIHEQWKCPVSILELSMKKAAELYFIGLSSSEPHSSLPEYHFPENMLDEGYVLDISAGGIVVVAPSPRGLFYGVMSLIQMIRASESGKLPCVLIKDYPALAWRGISDDISRGQV
jgi:alpha-glucuronidase